MDEEMEDFIVECSDVVSEIDSEYEFDASRFYDFCRPESTSEAEEAERWFQMASTYPPSPLIIKLNLGKEITAGNSNGCSRLQEGKMAKSKGNNSYIPVGSEVSPSKSKTKGTISKGQTTREICKTKPEPRSSTSRGSTLMKPTASHLAKQKFQNASNKTDVTSSTNSLASEIIATKRQKLEIGYLLKDTSSISISAHPKSKVTVPREPELETLQRAQRRRPNAQNAVNPGKSVTSLKSRSHKCNKESKSILDEKLSVHPPIELFNKLSLRSEKETREVSKPKKNPSAKELKENTPNCLQIKFRKCVGKTNQCAAERANDRFGLHSSMNRRCGFYGNPSNHNLCSQCYQAFLKEEMAKDVSILSEKISSLTIIAEKDDHSTKIQKPQKCMACMKKVGLIGFNCKCGGIFCKKHRYPEEHGCVLDFKSIGRAALVKENPLCKVDKLENRI
uniref:Stress-associated protein 8 n=1 Tax=Solanum tuberosum TaxID=4113 RepID=M1D265_SOLTU